MTVHEHRAGVGMTSHSYMEGRARRRHWWEPKPPLCPDMLFDRKGYRVEIRECGVPIDVVSVPDPFVRTAVVMHGWRVALAVLLGRWSIEVLVSADKATVERVLELNPDYLGAPGSERRKAWHAELNRRLATFGRDSEDPR